MNFEVYNVMNMRIISGFLKGRQFNSPPGHRSHPMSDKVRGALFSSLGDIKGLTALDGFAGSGGLSFEALSRGAAHVTAVEIDKTAHKTIEINAKALGAAKQIKAIRANVSSWSDNNESARFDLVLCDPPYDQLQLKILQKLVRHVKHGGVYVLSWPGKLEVPEFIGLNLIQKKLHGDAQLAFYRRIS